MGSTYRKYFRALSLVYRLAGNTKQWYNTNGHGDVIALTNATGTVTKTYTYNAFTGLFQQYVYRFAVNGFE